MLLPRFIWFVEDDKGKPIGSEPYPAEQYALDAARRAIAHGAAHATVFAYRLTERIDVRTAVTREQIDEEARRG